MVGASGRGSCSTPDETLFSRAVLDAGMGPREASEGRFGHVSSPVDPEVGSQGRLISDRIWKLRELA